MGVKKLLPYYSIVTNGVMTGTSVVTSSVTNIQNLDDIGIQVAWTSTAVGVIEVQCSVDNVTFYALTFDPVLTQPAGSAGGYLIDLQQVPFLWLRVQYTNSAGSGVLNVGICGKDIN